MKIRKTDKYEQAAREMAINEGLNPDARIDRPGKRSWPVWCSFREAVKINLRNEEQLRLKNLGLNSGQLYKYKDAPLNLFGYHDTEVIEQMRTCMQFGNVIAGVLCADGHLGYSQPVGGVIAYEDQISVSGVGYDIACGNMAVRLDTKYEDIKDRAHMILSDIRKHISFGVGGANHKPVEHSLFDDNNLWQSSGMEFYKSKAKSQLGTVGSGNHYVDLFYDKDGFVWIGVHFGSRGLGHTTASKMLKLTGSKDGVNSVPTLLDTGSDLGRQYLDGMKLSGQYAYAGREWVVERVRQIIGGTVTRTVHNHHNYAWKERHFGKDLWVVRKGATPCFPGQEGFIGGSMGDNAFIIEGVNHPDSELALFSTVHGAGRAMSRKAAKENFTKLEMVAWLKLFGVILSGGDIDESPMAYKRISEVLFDHRKTVKINYELRPFAVAMAGSADFDPWKD